MVMVGHMIAVREDDMNSYRSRPKKPTSNSDSFDDSDTRSNGISTDLVPTLLDMYDALYARLAEAGPDTALEGEKGEGEGEKTEGEKREGEGEKKEEEKRAGDLCVKESVWSGGCGKCGSGGGGEGVRGPAPFSSFSSPGRSLSFCTCANGPVREGVGVPIEENDYDIPESIEAPTCPQQPHSRGPPTPTKGPPLTSLRKGSSFRFPSSSSSSQVALSSSCRGGLGGGGPYRPVSVISSSSSSSSSSSNSLPRGPIGGGALAYLASAESLEGDEGGVGAHVRRRDRGIKARRDKALRAGSGDSGVQCHLISLPSPPPLQPRYCDANLDYMDRVVLEILETEALYVKDLDQVIQGYLEYWRRNPESGIPPDTVEALFSNIEQIYTFNRCLLCALDDCGTDPVAIARCFVRNNAGFAIYTEYCTNYPRTVDLLTDLMRSESSVLACRRRQLALGHTLPLGSYLLKPVQRVLKYHLLLGNIVKHYPKDRAGLPVIWNALSAMTGLAHHINDMKKRHEHAVRVQEIQSLLYGWEGEDLTTYGELSAEGTFKMFGHRGLRHVFLFEKVLIIAKKKGSKRGDGGGGGGGGSGGGGGEGERDALLYKAHVMCSDLMLIESIPRAPLAFHVIPFDNPKSQYTLECRNLDQKREWTLELKRVILENFSAEIPEHARQIVMELGQAKKSGDLTCSSGGADWRSPGGRRAHTAPEYLEKRKDRRRASEGGGGVAVRVRRASRAAARKGNKEQPSEGRSRSASGTRGETDDDDITAEREKKNRLRLPMWRRRSEPGVCRGARLLAAPSPPEASPQTPPAAPPTPVTAPPPGREGGGEEERQRRNSRREGGTGERTSQSRLTHKDSDPKPALPSHFPLPPLPLSEGEGERGDDDDADEGRGGGGGEGESESLEQIVHHLLHHQLRLQQIILSKQRRKKKQYETSDTENDEGAYDHSGGGGLTPCSPPPGGEYPSRLTGLTRGPPSLTTGSEWSSGANSPCGGASLHSLYRGADYPPGGTRSVGGGTPGHYDNLWGAGGPLCKGINTVGVPVVVRRARSFSSPRGEGSPDGPPSPSPSPSTSSSSKISSLSVTHSSGDLEIQTAKERPATIAVYDPDCPLPARPECDVTLASNMTSSMTTSSMTPKMSSSLTSSMTFSVSSLTSSLSPSMPSPAPAPLSSIHPEHKIYSRGSSGGKSSLKKVLARLSSPSSSPSSSSRLPLPPSSSSSSPLPPSPSSLVSSMARHCSRSLKERIHQIRSEEELLLLHKQGSSSIGARLASSTEGGDYAVPVLLAPRPPPPPPPCAPLYAPPGRSSRKDKPELRPDSVLSSSSSSSSNHTGGGTPVLPLDGGDEGGGRGGTAPPGGGGGGGDSFYERSFEELLLEDDLLFRDSAIYSDPEDAPSPSPSPSFLPPSFSPSLFPPSSSSLSLSPRASFNYKSRRSSSFRTIAATADRSPFSSVSPSLSHREDVSSFKCFQRLSPSRAASSPLEVRHQEREAGERILHSPNTLLSPSLDPSFPLSLPSPSLTTGPLTTSLTVPPLTTSLTVPPLTTSLTALPLTTPLSPTKKVPPPVPAKPPNGPKWPRYKGALIQQQLRHLEGRPPLEYTISNIKSSIVAHNNSVSSNLKSINSGSSTMGSNITNIKNSIITNSIIDLNQRINYKSDNTSGAANDAAMVAKGWVRHVIGKLQQ